MNAVVYLRLATIEALRSLMRNKVRSALAILGVTTGVATVICVVAIGGAGTDQAMAALDGLGENLVWIEAGSRTTGGVRSGSHGMTTLVAADADAIRAEVPLVARVSENIDGRTQIMYAGANWNSQFRGVSPDYPSIRRWDIARGTFFSEDDVARATTVLVIGDTVRQKLFGDIDPIGEHVRIKASQFTVIGVFAPKGQSVTGQDQDDTMMMPWTTARNRVVGKNQTWLDDIVCSATSSADVVAAGDQIADLLRARHHIAAGTEDDFNIRHPEDLAKSKIKSAETLERLLIVIASLALLVGGIGIMNVMLASVAQRTAEIGIRMATGARPAAIRVQFLGEAVMLTALGGAIGLALAATSAPAIAGALGWAVSPPAAQADAIAVGFAILVGIVFGFYPAARAAQLDPIEALRSAE